MESTLPPNLAEVEVPVILEGMLTVTELLRVALEKCGESRYAVSKATGIPESVLSRFARGQPLRGENLDKLCEYLRLTLKPKSKRKGR
jgi:hypothetical protein